jgi:outer membrane autotransporter protein
MDRGDFRGPLLTTSSVLALCVGLGSTAWAQCYSQNSNVDVVNNASNNCITFFDGAAHPSNVTNNSTLTGIAPYPPLNPGTSTGISVVKSGTQLNGNIVNNGTISAQHDGINIGEGSSGSPATNVNVGATVNGSIINNGTITNAVNAGIAIKDSNVTGSIVNTTGNLIQVPGVGIDIAGTLVNGVTIGGSVINNGTIQSTAGNQGLYIYNANVTQSVSNGGTITAPNATAITLAHGTIGGSFINTGSISDVPLTNANAVLIDNEQILGSVENLSPGSISGNYGFEIQNSGSNATVISQNLLNSGTINATFGTTNIGIALFSSTVGGVISNSGSITAAQYGVMMLNYFGGFGDANGTPTAASITNSGTISITGTGFASPVGILLAGASISGDVVNAGAGVIQNAKGVGIYVGNATASTTTVGSTVSGNLVNKGTINAKTGIVVAGGSIVAGAVVNSGNITGSTAAIDFTGAGAAMTLNQQGGTITGNILLSPNGDTVNITGGAIAGNVVGANSATGGTVNFALGTGTYTTGGTFNVDNININSGTVVLANDATVFGALTNNATLQLNNTGTRTLTGAFAQSAAGTLAMEISPTGAALLHVTGKATLAGTLLPLYDPGTYSATTYTLMQAGSISGNFAQLGGTPPAGFTQSETTTATQVQLTLGGAAQPLVVKPSNATVFSATTSTLILNDQQLIGLVLNQIGSHFGGEDTGTGTAGLGSPDADMQMQQLASLAGNTNLGAIEQVAQALPQAVSDYGGWFRGVGSFASINGSSAAPGFNGDVGGFLAGFDRPIAPGLYAGVAAGYTHSDINESPTNGNVDTAHVLVYGGGALAIGYWSATAGYSHDSISTARGIAGIGTATQSHGGNEFNGGAQWAVPTPIAGLGGGTATLTPKLGIIYTHLGEDGFSETGAGGFDLTNSGQSTDSVQPFVGLGVSQTFVTPDGTQIAPSAHIGYSHELASDNRLLNVGVVSGATFIIQGVKPSRDMLTTGVGITVRLQDSLAFYANYDALVRTGNTSDQTVSAGLRVRF